MVSVMSSISVAFPAGKKNRVFCRGFLGQETVTPTLTAFKVYSDETAYNYFCDELENILYHRFGLKPEFSDKGALIRIAHCYAEAQANDLKALVLEKHPNTRFIIEPTTALCSFYAEAGGLMIGFEGGYNQENNNIDF